MGGYGVKEGEVERANKLRDAGLKVAEISRQMARSTTFVNNLLATPPKHVNPSPAVAMTADRRALADMIIGMDMSKDQKLKVLEAIL